MSFNAKDMTQGGQIANMRFRMFGQIANIIFYVLCNETGVTWPSIRKAASDLGVSYSRLRQHLNGEELNVFGFTYTILGEAHAPI
jgi:hypothetical protein